MRSFSSFSKIKSKFTARNKLMDEKTNFFLTCDGDKELILSCRSAFKGHPNLKIPIVLHKYLFIFWIVNLHANLVDASLRNFF